MIPLCWILEDGSSTFVGPFYIENVAAADFLIFSETRDRPKFKPNGPFDSENLVICCNSAFQIIKINLKPSREILHSRYSYEKNDSK